MTNFKAPVLDYKVTLSNQKEQITASSSVALEAALILGVTLVKLLGNLAVMIVIVTGQATSNAFKKLRDSDKCVSLVKEAYAVKALVLVKTDEIQDIARTKKSEVYNLVRTKRNEIQDIVRTRKNKVQAIVHESNARVQKFLDANHLGLN